MKKLAQKAFCLSLCLLLGVEAVLAQGANSTLAAYNEPPSRLSGVIEKFDADLGVLNRFYSAQTSPDRAARFRQLYREKLELLDSLSFDALNHDEQIDYILFRNHLNRELKELDRGAAQLAEMAGILPFASTISGLEDARRRLEFVDPAPTAALLNNLAKQIVATQRLMDANTAKPKRTVANRAARTVDSLRRTLRSWYTFYNAYDPTFTWWCESPYKAADDALAKYSTYITEKLVGIRADDRTTIIGDPIGRAALIEELGFEMIPYTPEELVEIANREFEWCITEFKKASREMGYGDDYMKAIEAVKLKYVEPGKQPELIRKQAYEAIEYIEKNNLVTVPKIARDGWRMEMMTPERQLVAPFFLGGETILVAYPTDGMTHEQKMMSMRGNNPHFARAVTHHELIPGHHLQGFMTRRHRPYREMFRTPF
ncbi:MAG: DUF885 family protein, partial [Pyrinomonadaceae bacterium]